MDNPPHKAPTKIINSDYCCITLNCNPTTERGTRKNTEMVRLCYFGLFNSNTPNYFITTQKLSNVDRIILGLVL